MSEKCWYEEDKKIFVSKPLAKIFFANGLGFYILTSYKTYFLPRFYFMYRKNSFLETGVRFLFWNFEIMWNKHFRY